MTCNRASYLQISGFAFSTLMRLAAVLIASAQFAPAGQILASLPVSTSEATNPPIFLPAVAY